MLFLLLRWRPKVEPDTMISHDLVIPKQLQKKILAMPSVEVFRVSARSGSKKIWSNFSSDRFSALRVSWARTAGGPTSWASRSSPPSYRWASCPSARSRPDTCSSRDRGSKTQETVRLGFEPPATGYQSFLQILQNYNVFQSSLCLARSAISESRATRFVSAYNS